MADPTATIPAKPAADERKLGGLMAFAVLATLLASTCCVLPLVLVLVGITGAWMAGLQALAPVTPYAIALALGALVWSGWLVFRPARFCTTADGACATTRPLMRRVYLACLALAVLLLGFPLVAPLFY